MKYLMKMMNVWQNIKFQIAQNNFKMCSWKSLPAKLNLKTCLHFRLSSMWIYAGSELVYLAALGRITLCDIDMTYKSCLSFHNDRMLLRRPLSTWHRNQLLREFNYTVGCQWRCQTGKTGRRQPENKIA